MKAQDFMDMISTSALLELVNKGDMERIKYLIDHGLDINKQSKYGETMLARAVKTNATDIATYLIKAGANVNIPVFELASSGACKCNKYSLLCKVAYHDKSAAILKELIANHPELNIHEVDHRGNSILDYAIRGQNQKAIELLVKLGAKTNSYNLSNFNNNDITLAQEV